MSQAAAILSTNNKGDGMLDGWTYEQTQIPARLHALMQEAEYHLACADAPAGDRISALTELIEWCHDLRVTVYTGVPMADSDRLSAMDAPA